MEPAVLDAAEQRCFQIVKFEDPNAAIGMAARMMMDRPVFAQRPFGPWMKVIEGQARRGHQLFVVDEADMTVGYLGYSYANESVAAAWARGTYMPTYDECMDGDCILFNAFIANDRTVFRVVWNAARRLAQGKTAAYFKRFYPDGRPMRPSRLTINAMVDRHISRADGRMAGIKPP